MSEGIKLCDLGERRILDEIIPTYASGAGDDCANIGIINGHVLITTDPVPSPAADVIAGDPNPYWLGWLLVTINASDLAAAGAKPKAFVSALELPSNMLVGDLHQLLSGIRDSCRENGLAYVGGNMREADKIGAVGTAIGSASSRPLTRNGARAGDKVLVIGDGGRFWADVERLHCGLMLDRSRSPLFSPVSQSKIVSALHTERLLRCGMDTSDGLAPTLVELAKKNKLKIEIDLRTMRVSHQDVCPTSERLWFGWGDWTVVAAVRPDQEEATKSLLLRLGATFTFIGTFCVGTPQVILKDGSAEVGMDRLESERFAADSWFAKGIEEYRRQMKVFTLPRLL